MRKPRRRVQMRLPIEVARAVIRIAKLSDTSPTNVINVLLATAMLRLEKDVAPVADAVRRAPTR